MFDEKKLIILENALKNKIFSEEFLKYIKKNKIKDDQNIIVVIYQEGKLTRPSLTRQVSMFEEFKLLSDNDLINWLKNKRVKIKQISVRKL